MRILFVNPPVYRSKFVNEDNNFKQSKIHQILHAFPKKIRVKLYTFNSKLFPNRKQTFGVRAGSRWPWVMKKPPGVPHYPFFMGYAAGAAEKEGHTVGLLDYVAKQSFCYENFFKDVVKFEPEVVVFEVTNPTYDIDIFCIKKIGNLLPKTKLILAGAGITKETSDKIKQQTNRIHSFIQGEYAISLKNAIKGKGNEYFIGESLMDLKNFAYPYKNYKEAACYFDPSMPTKTPQLQIYGSKGCPFRCTFCSWPQLMYKRKVVLRTADEIKREIDHAMKFHNYKSIFFDDDTFNLDANRVSKISSMLKEYKLPWTWMGRLDCSPDWLYDQMIEDGCVGMRFGVETFALTPLKAIKKGLERIDFEDALRRLTQKHKDLMIHITMMKNMPLQTQADHERDMRIIKEMGFVSQEFVNTASRTYQLSDCEPYPGTELYDQVDKGMVSLTHQVNLEIGS